MSESKTKREMVLKIYDPSMGCFTPGITMEELSEVLKSMRKSLTDSGFTSELVDDILASWFDSQHFFALPEGK